MRESPPETCPRCRYELQRVPVRDECPECAFAFDEHTVVWRPTNRWRPLVVAAGFAAPFGIGVWTLVRPFLNPPVSDVELVATAVLFVMSACFLLVIMRQNRRGSFLAVGPFGIHARSWHGDIFVPWSEYDFVYGVGRGLRLIRQDAKAPLRIPSVFDHAAEIAEFREAIAAALARNARAALNQ